MKRVLVEMICILFMILFLYTGISKLLEVQVFEEQLRESVFKPIASLVTWVLPLTEIGVALILLVPKWRLKGLYSSMVLMTAFTIYVVGLVSFAHELPCSCGGIIKELSWPQHIVFNFVFLVLAIWGIWLFKRFSEENRVSGSSVVV